MPELAHWRVFFRVSEAVVVALFTVEFFVFWSLSRNRRAYPFRLLNIVDLLAILLFYLQLAIDLRGLRAVRLLRIVRIVKLGRYNRALNTVVEAFVRSFPELAVVAAISGIIIVISAMGLYYAEHDAQPEVYSSIPASLWWAVVTLTTVGYGDVYPQTLLGKMIASIIMLTGIGIIAMPTGILSSTMTEIVHQRRRLGDSNE